MSETVARLRGEVVAVLLWGSHAAGRAHERSDVDLCVVVGPSGDRERARSAALRATTERVDVKVFEDLPLYLQGAVIEADRLLWAEDEVALWEYLRPYRRRWADQKHRIAANDEALKRALAEP